MKIADVKLGRRYRGTDGSVREVVRFTNSRRQPGPTDGVTYRVVEGNGAGGEYTMRRVLSFARWARADVTPPDDVTPDQPPAANSQPPINSAQTDSSAAADGTATGSGGTVDG